MLVFVSKEMTWSCLIPPPMMTKLSELIGVAQAPKTGEESGMSGPCDQVEELVVRISVVVADYQPPRINTSPVSRVTVDAYILG